MAKLKAVIFDVDGTLFDTFEYIVQAFETVVAEYGKTPNRDEIITVIGKTLIECYEELLPEEDAVEAANRHHVFQQDPARAKLIQVYDGLREVLAVLKAMDIKVAIFTNRWRQGLDLLFENIGLEDEFDAIITPESVKQGKPDPEGITLIAKQLGIKAEETIMIGDTAIDITTGKNAGTMATIGITHGFGTKEQLDAAGADYTVDSLSDIPVLIKKL